MSPLDDAEWMVSPANLARADVGNRFKLPRHLKYLNKELVDVGLGKNGRLITNMPFQVGKSWLCSHYFPAWMLLLNPQLRIILAAHEERYAASFGSKVREVILKFGAELGIELRADSQAKNEWVIQGHGGGMVCRGMKGSLIGRAGDVLLIDDPIKNPEQAMSQHLLESQWDWYQTVAYSRLGPTAPIVIVTTRWCKGDLVGRILEEAKLTGEPWRVVKFKAIAEQDDPLGRAPGEALWPERQPLQRLEWIRDKRPRWFAPCYQQEPEDVAGLYFKPRHPDGSWKWPLYTFLQNAYSLCVSSGRRKLVLACDVIRITTVDWAWSKKSSADYTAIGTFGLCPGGELLVLDVQNRRLRAEELAPALDAVCRRFSPHVVAVETGHPTLAQEYRRFDHIPQDVRWLSSESKNKLLRALAAIMMGENGRIYLPDDSPQWLGPFVSQLASFDGLENDHDDMVDAIAYGAKLAQEMHVVPRHDEMGPDLLTPGKEFWW